MYVKTFWNAEPRLTNSTRIRITVRVSFKRNAAINLCRTSISHFRNSSGSIFKTSAVAEYRTTSVHFLGSITASDHQVVRPASLALCGPPALTATRSTGQEPSKRAYLQSERIIVLILILLGVSALFLVPWSKRSTQNISWVVLSHTAIITSRFPRCSRVVTVEEAVLIHDHSHWAWCDFG
jgi:hypothetical protein